ncbi:MAG TPA: limonene-1,2-epoxide hydrolase family protein [Acidimicrobiales bacterium]|nr:limonene-1,2-epoxide hydrolase family protein [Acidimicrobiales bacterium]
MGTEHDAEKVVREFCDAVIAHDAEVLRPFFSDDVVYHNIPMDPAVGIEATVAFLAGFMSMFDKMEIEISHLAVRGDVVLTERVDTLTMGQVTAPLPVMGTFEIHDGKIRAWRDYFDMAQITKMLSGEA